MQILEFRDEYHDLSADRRKRGLQKIFDTIMSDPSRFEGVISGILNECVDFEMDDGFGTEGLDV